MLRLEPKQSSFHSVLYDKIPENHILKKITTVVDFSFINELLMDSYSKRLGRPAKEPELMCANTKKKTPERLMKHLGRQIIQTFEDETGQSLEKCTYGTGL